MKDSKIPPSSYLVAMSSVFGLSSRKEKKSWRDKQYHKSKIAKLSDRKSSSMDNGMRTFDHHRQWFGLKFERVSNYDRHAKKAGGKSGKTMKKDEDINSNKSMYTVFCFWI